MPPAVHRRFQVRVRLLYGWNGVDAARSGLVHAAMRCTAVSIVNSMRTESVDEQ